ncbi:MAG TPA: hypothetical protein VJY34_01135 [Roseiarcus sp.]|nr:hypothetical protein [Roseiarcus sp.]
MADSNVKINLNQSLSDGQVKKRCNSVDVKHNTWNHLAFVSNRDAFVFLAAIRADAALDAERRGR